MADISQPSPAPTTSEVETPKPMTPADTQLWGKMATHMDLFHENFRYMWTTMHSACTSNRRPSGMSIRQFIRYAEDFIRYLTTHHDIEEAYIFPMLASKMDKFRANGDHKKQHEGIHAGLDRFEAYLKEVRSGERELVLREMGEVMDSFGEVLWLHLDEEVKTLGAENMRKYWSREEMEAFPVSVGQMR